MDLALPMFALETNPKGILGRGQLEIVNRARDSAPMFIPHRSIDPAQNLAIAPSHGADIPIVKQQLQRPSLQPNPLRTLFR
jgi:hypothetical protein